MKTFYGLVGAGGYGREVMPLLKESLSDRIVSGDVELFFVVEGEVLNPIVNDYPVISLNEFMLLNGRKFFNIAIADSKSRERIANNLVNHGVDSFSIIAPNSLIFDKNQLGEGLILSPFVSITSNVKIGKFFHANIYSYVAHDCIIGDYVTFAPRVNCNGNIIIEDHAYIGTGAVIMPGAKESPLIIGHNSIVGMGAIVTKNVPPFSTVFGNPARLIKN